MKNKFTFWHEKGFQRYFFTYILLFACALTLGTVIVAHTKQNEWQKSQAEHQQLQGEKITEMLDSVWESAERITDFLDDAVWVQKYKSDTDVFDEEFDAIKRKEISQSLSSICASNELVWDIAVLYGRKDTVITPKGWFNIDSYQKYVSDTMRMPDYFVRRCILGQPVDNVAGMIEDFAEQQEGCLVYSRPLDLIESPRAFAAIYVDKAQIGRALRQVCSEQVQSVRILDSNGNECMVKQMFPESSRTVKQTYKSKNSQFSYEIAYEPVQQKWIESIGGYLLLLGLATLGAILAFVVANAQYKPIYRLASTLRNHTKGNISSETGMQAIAEGIDALCEDKQTLEQALETYQNDMHEQMNIRLLKGYFSDDMSEILNVGNLPFLCDYAYTVLVLQRQEDEQIGAVQATEERLKFMLSLRQTFQKLELGQSHCEIVENVENNTAVIIEFLKTPDRNTVMEFAERLYEAFVDQDIQCRIYAGCPRKGLIGISASYQAAMEAMRTYSAGSDVVYANPATEYFYPLDWESQLAKSIREGNEKQGSTILRQLYEENKRINPGRTMLTRIETMLYETMHRIVMEEKFPPQCFKEIKEPGYSQNLEEVFYEADHALRILCSEMKQKKQEAASNVDRSLVKYVDENVFDPDLSLNLLSDRFGVSNASISRIFKKAAGENFYNYITAKRMERAKELLKLRGYCPSEIASEIGYDNEYSFKRAFQRMYGTSPREFAEKEAEWEANESQTQ